MSDRNREYLVLVYQGDCGCDYTIGCGMTWEHRQLDEDPEKAAREAAEWAMDYYGEDRVQDVSVVPVDQITEADVESVKDDAEKEEWEADLRSTEESERAELERLKNKYGEA